MSSDNDNDNNTASIQLTHWTSLMTEFDRSLWPERGREGECVCVYVLWCAVLAWAMCTLHLLSLWFLPIRIECGNMCRYQCCSHNNQNAIQHRWWQYARYRFMYIYSISKMYIAFVDCLVFVTYFVEILIKFYFTGFLNTIFMLFTVCMCVCVLRCCCYWVY